MSLAKYPFVLIEKNGDSYSFIRRFTFEGSPNGTVDDLLQVASSQIPREKQRKIDMENLTIELHELEESPNPKTLLTLDTSLTPDSQCFPGTALTDISNAKKLVVLYTIITIRYTIFKKASPYTYLMNGQIIGSPTENLQRMEATAATRLRTSRRAGESFSLAMWDPYVSIFPPKNTTNQKEIQRTLKEKENSFSDEYFANDCARLDSTMEFTGVANPMSMIIIASQRHEFEFNFVVLAAKPTTYTCVARGSCRGGGDDTAQEIENAARKALPARFMPLDIRIKVYEPNISREAFRTLIDPIDLDLRALKASATHVPITRKFWEIDNDTLAVVFDFTAQIRYTLFERKGDSFDFVNTASVEVYSADAVAYIQTAVKTYIRKNLQRTASVVPIINVYQPLEAFEEVYGKPDIDDLTLSVQHLQQGGGKCLLLSSESALPDMTSAGNLIVTFSMPEAELLELFDELDIARRSASDMAAGPVMRNTQENPTKRTLNDRPLSDSGVAPIALLYDGFGIFDDILQQIPVPGEGAILGSRLMEEVQKFCMAMSAFYPDEAARLSMVIPSLEAIFDARTDSQTMEPIQALVPGDDPLKTDGSMVGRHGAIAFIVECKNELDQISSEPHTELANYITKSFREGSRHRSMLFNGWRVPALGMIQAGANVQFLGLIALAGRTRVVPLTPMLPLNIPTGHKRYLRDIYLAFKAASVLVAKILADGRQLAGQTIPKIPLESRAFPYVTQVKAWLPEPSPKPSPSQLPEPIPEPIRFKITGRHKGREGRYLYDARDSQDRPILVKFTQTYSDELHSFCAKRGLAPGLLGLERFPGGWFAVAMEKVDTVGFEKVMTSSQVGIWKQQIKELVNAFHDKKLVHGDLRIANFIFTEPPARKIFLVDFDWGGEEGKVRFPFSPLAPGIQNDRNFGVAELISKEDDNRVLARMFELLEDAVTEVEKQKTRLPTTVNA